MLSYSEIVPGKVIVLDGEPYEVLASQVSKKSRQKAANQVKLRHLKTGKVNERGFHQSDDVDEAEIEKHMVVFLYRNKGEYWFHAEGAPKVRFSLTEELVGSSGVLLREKSTLEVVEFNGEVIGVSLPVKVDLVVTEAPPAVRGNTAQGATKQVTLETGATIAVPLFINQGDIVRVNTETGAYSERVEKG